MTKKGKGNWRPKGATKKPQGKGQKGKKGQKRMKGQRGQKIQTPVEQFSWTTGLHLRPCPLGEAALRTRDATFFAPLPPSPPMPAPSVVQGLISDLGGEEWFKVCRIHTYPTNVL
ncbi:hypothetical protein KIPB_013590 [Kipferlia bialata]|uniref:Uncharacterized protein n=1 Tax=Kipferlia bialata TaxID=797122 RepID=A0A391NUI5_9EUKA|nr:hypothetical protein KIPB_013590 [Kipferlia bialata]|eukprot:g13590.t1